MTETVPSPKFVTKVVVPSGVIAIPPTLLPTVMTSATVFVATSITVTWLPALSWPTYAFVPSGLIATETGVGSTVIVATTVRVAVSITETDAAALFVT